MNGTSSKASQLVGLIGYGCVMWLILRPGHTRIGPALSLGVARLCYRIAGEIGAVGLAAEANYWRQVR